MDIMVLSLPHPGILLFHGMDAFNEHARMPQWKVRLVIHIVKSILFRDLWEWLARVLCYPLGRAFPCGFDGVLGPSSPSPSY